VPKLIIANLVGPLICLILAVVMIIYNFVVKSEWNMVAPWFVLGVIGLLWWACTSALLYRKKENK
jgi:uncharacterized membrane protein YphA (DoxX/SURF4 family)